MAGVQFQTSFDHYTTITHRFQSIASSGGGPVISAGNGRNGSASIRFIGDAASIAAKTLPVELTDIYFAFAYRTASLPGVAGTRTIAEIRDVGTVQCDLILRADGTMQVRRGGSTVLGTLADFAMLPNVFYHIEWYIRINNSTGLVKVWINEVEKLNLTSQDTQQTANSTASEIVLAHKYTGTNSNINTDFDDLVVRDDQQIGDVQVKAFLPTGLGSTDQWTPTGAATTREAVDESAPDEDTSYISETTVGEKSLFTYDTLPSTSSIHAVIPMPRAKKTDAGTAKIKSTVRSGGNNYPGAEKAPSDGAYEYHPDILMVNPDTGVAFTITEWNAIEIGPERSA